MASVANALDQNFYKAFSASANRVAQVFQIVNDALVAEEVSPGTGNDAFLFHPDVAGDAKRLFQKARGKSPEETQQIFAAYLSENITSALAPYLPAGIDPKGVASFLGGVLPRLKVTDSPDGSKTDYEMTPNGPFAEFIRNINTLGEGIGRIGALPNSRVMDAPSLKKKWTPGVPMKITVHWNLNGNREQQAEDLAKQGQKFANPFVATGVFIAVRVLNGKNPLERDGKLYSVRTAKAKTSKGQNLESLESFGLGSVNCGGVCALSYFGDDAFPDLVAVGALKSS